MRRCTARAHASKQPGPVVFRDSLFRCRGVAPFDGPRFVDSIRAKGRGNQRIVSDGISVRDGCVGCEGERRCQGGGRMLQLNPWRDEQGQLIQESSLIAKSVTLATFRETTNTVGQTTAITSGKSSEQLQRPSSHSVFATFGFAFRHGSMLSDKALRCVNTLLAKISALGTACWTVVVASWLRPPVLCSQQ